MYIKTAYLTKDQKNLKIKKYIDINKKNKFFHLHETVSQKILPKEISKYDFGVFSFETTTKNNDKISTGNKFSSYLEAGIPIITLKEFETLGKLVEKYKIGINIGSKELHKLRKIIKSKNNKEFLKNIPKARKDLSIRKHIPRLENFFKEVIKFKKNKDQPS